MLHIRDSIEACRGSGPCRSRFNTARIAALSIGVFLVPCALAQTAPQLTGVTPSTGTTNVPVTTTIVFEFDQPMDTSVSFVPTLEFLGTKYYGNIELITGEETLYLDASWSQDGHTLTGSLFTGEFPPGTPILWTLNPSGGGDDPFINNVGVPLGEVSGSFTTAGQPPGGGDEDCDGVPDAWGFYGIFKGVNYEQTSAADPLPAAEHPYNFGALVGSPDAGPALTEASITFPDGNPQDLSGSSQNLAFLRSGIPSEAELDLYFPAGSWTLRFTQTGEAERPIPMTMPVNNVPIPKAVNYVEAQTIVATQDFELQWNSFDTAGPDDFLSLVVESDFSLSPVFQAPDLCISRELPVTATSVVIPANTLVPDQIYTATLKFSKVFYQSTNPVLEMAGSGTLVRATTFTLNTGSGGGTAIPAMLTAKPIISNGNPQIQLTGSVGQTYRVERTGTLINPVWLNLGSVTMDGAGQGMFEDTSAGQVFPLFYRAVAD